MLLDGYVRVSRVAGRKGDRFISPKVQRQQIATWAANNGAVVGEVFEEMDRSGADIDRPLLQQALDRIEKGRSEGLIVHKLNRFARSLIDGLTLIARIQEAGGTFVSVEDGLDLKTPTGKLALRILFSVAEWEYEQARENWQIARENAVERGVYCGNRAPIGYRRDADGRLHPDPEAIAVIAEVFRRRGEGAKLRHLAAYMNEMGIVNSVETAINGEAVARLLANRAYLGESWAGAVVNSCAHEPMVDEPTWQRAQFRRHRRPSTIGVLVGLLRCGGCGRSMGVTMPRHTGSGGSRYRCGGTIRTPVPCERPAAARAEELEPLVEELIFKLARSNTPAGTDRRVLEAEARVDAAKEALQSYRDDPSLQRRLGMSSFGAGLAKRQELLERELLDLAMARRATQKPRVELTELERRWPAMSVHQRREVHKELIDCVVVEAGEWYVIERAWYCRRGRGPEATALREDPVPFDPRRHRAARLREPALWPQIKIREQLQRFLAGRSEWPQYPAFEKAGYARLHAQVMAFGGPYYWAKKLGIDIPGRAVVWNELRVEGALRPLVRGRTRYPRWAEFVAAGLGEAYQGARNHGGHGHWAEHFGLAFTPHEPDEWPKSRIEAELRRVLKDSPILPNEAEFKRAGFGELHKAIRTHGDRLYWAKRLGIEPSRRTWGRWPPPDGMKLPFDGS